MNINHKHIDLVEKLLEIHPSMVLDSKFESFNVVKEKINENSTLYDENNNLFIVNKVNDGFSLINPSGIVFNNKIKVVVVKDLYDLFLESIQLKEHTLDKFISNLKFILED